MQLGTVLWSVFLETEKALLLMRWHLDKVQSSTKKVLAGTWGCQYCPIPLSLLQIQITTYAAWVKSLIILI